VSKKGKKKKKNLKGFFFLSNLCACPTLVCVHTGEKCAGLPGPSRLLLGPCALQCQCQSPSQQQCMYSTCEITCMGSRGSIWCELQASHTNVTQARQGFTGLPTSTSSTPLTNQADMLREERTLSSVSRWSEGCVAE
jgi:hypothetical protein